MNLLAAPPNWAEVVTAVFTALTMFVLLGTAIFVWRQLSESEGTRLATLVTDLTRRWDEPLLQSARLEFSSLTAAELRTIVELSYAEPRGPEDQIYLRLQALPNFFEYLGVLEARVEGGVPLELINVLWRTSILSTWRRWHPTIDWIREKAGTQTFYGSFEGLAEKIRQLPPPTRTTTWAGEPATQATGPAVRQSVRPSVPPSIPDHSADRTFGVLAAAAGLGALSAILLRKRNAS
jgi:hypothetical protein